jgi:hypothetical protein
VRAAYAARRRAPLASQRQARLPAWLGVYATGWLDQAAVARGGRYDRLAELVGSGLV